MGKYKVREFSINKSPPRIIQLCFLNPITELVLSRNSFGCNKVSLYHALYQMYHAMLMSI